MSRRFKDMRASSGGARLKTAKTVKTAGRRRSSADESYFVLAAPGAPPHVRS
jgi:hypothetical protein